VAVLLVAGTVVFNAAFSAKNDPSGIGWGGASLISRASAAQSLHSLNDLTIAATANGQDATSLAYQSYGNASGNYLAQEEGDVFDANAGTVKDPGGTFTDSTTRSGIISYVVRSGDTLPSIAAYFGITVNTITAVNPQLKDGVVVPGKTIKILPVSGVIYTTQQGDTLASIASSYNVSIDQIIQANPSVDLSSASGPIPTFLPSGMALIIPTGK
jgi:LysM repeat protein